MEFLVQTEESLAVEISGNYPSLVEQQKAHEVLPLPQDPSAAFAALSDWLTFSAKLISFNFIPLKRSYTLPSKVLGHLEMFLFFKE